MSIQPKLSPALQLLNLIGNDPTLLEDDPTKPQCRCMEISRFEEILFSLPDVHHHRIIPECEGCHGMCCRISTVIYPHEEGMYDTVPSTNKWRMQDGERYLRKVDGVCVYLKDGKCSVQDNKPKSCREWDCRIHGGPDWIKWMVEQETKEKEE